MYTLKISNSYMDLCVKYVCTFKNLNSVVKIAAEWLAIFDKEFFDQLVTENCRHTLCYTESDLNIIFINLEKWK